MASRCISLHHHIPIIVLNSKIIFFYFFGAMFDGFSDHTVLYYWHFLCQSVHPLSHSSACRNRIRLSSRIHRTVKYPITLSPARPRNCLSTLRDSCRSVPMMARPPNAFTSSLIFMSVPLPAIFVAIVTFLLPASARFRFPMLFGIKDIVFDTTQIGDPAHFSDNSTDVSTHQYRSSSRQGLRFIDDCNKFFAICFEYEVPRSSLTHALLVGMTTTSSL